MQITTYHDLLNEELERRRHINGSYSLRAFARDLGIPVSRLSMIMNKKEGLSVKKAQGIAEALRLDEQKKQWFCDSVGSMHARSNKEREAFKKKIQGYKSKAKTYSNLQLEYFKVISDWWHFAILELTYLADFKNDPDWIASMLDISKKDVIEAIERMKELDLVEEKDGKLIDVFKFLATPSDTPSMSLKKFNTQLMKKAMEALYERDINEREMASNIFAVRKDKVPEFKEKLRTFRRELESEASSLTNKDSVYCLNMNFYELTNRRQ